MGYRTNSFFLTRVCPKLNACFYETQGEFGANKYLN